MYILHFDGMLRTAIVFVVSSVFPLLALFVRDTTSWPKWWGVLDVSLAFILAIMAFSIYGLARNSGNLEHKEIEAATYRAYRVLIHGIFILILVFFIAGDRITWINLMG